MPELPEVETIVRHFAPLLAGRRIRSFSATWPRQITPSIPTLRKRVIGRRIVTLARRGKHILASLDDQTALIWHLKMSGRFEWAADCPATPNHVRMRLGLSGGHDLLFCDARKFGRLRHAKDPAAALAHLGPEPLAVDFTGARLHAMLRARSRRLKPLLLDQAFLAGLGNIYTDESLFAARLHPLRRSSTLSRAESNKLHRAIRAVLRRGIEYNGTSLDWIYPGGRMQAYLKVYGRAGQACPGCRRPIQRILVGQRSTHLCPACQRA